MKCEKSQKRKETDGNEKILIQRGKKKELV